MRQSSIAAFWAISIILCLTGCVFREREPQQALEKTANQIASSHGFTKTLIKTNPFTLTSFQKLTKPHEPMTIYIEGDGRTWISRTKLSSNPTPRNPLALKLAVLDKSANVVYLTRACQYTPPSLNPACTPAIWSDERFSKIVIHSMNEAIEKIKKDANVRGANVQKANAKAIHLVGFSGGAAIAVLIAANRNDIATLRTVAGDLNHAALSQYHHTTPLQNSLNPITVAHKIITLPQQHFAGAKDQQVPPFISKEFVDEIIKQGGHCASRTVLKDVTHHQGWEKAWPALLNMPFKCLQ